MAAKTFDEWVHDTMETEHIPTNAGGWLRRAWEAATLAAEEKLTAANTARDEIFSSRICDYCQGCPNAMDGNCLEFDRFRGKKLSPVA